MKLPDSINQILQKKWGMEYTILGSKTIENCVVSRRSNCKLNSNEEYFDLLKKSHSELENFVDGLLVPETWFFRDDEPFSYFAKWVDSRKKDLPFLRILSIPCSTGEEAYSIAITLVNHSWSPKNFMISAIDVSSKYLAIAQKGEYTQKSFRGSKIEDYSNYLDKIDLHRYRIKDSIKSSIKFSKNNFLNPHFLVNESPFDVIFARNLLIYLTQEAKITFIAALERLLKSSGILIVGHADNILSLTNTFKMVGPTAAFAFIKNQSIVSKTQFFFPENNKRPTELRGSETLKSGIKNEDFAKQLQIAYNFADHGKISEAYLVCSKLLKSHSTKAEIYFLIGQLDLSQNNSEKAEKMFRKALYLKPNFKEVLYQLELLYIRYKDFERAKLYHERLEKLTSQSNHDSKRR